MAGRGSAPAEDGFNILIAYFTWADNTAVENTDAALERALGHYGRAGGSASADDGPNILIAYFTWADNTHVADPNAVDVDATTSASILAPGSAARIAGWIQQAVGGGLHSIVVEDRCPSNYDQCLDRAAGGKAAGARPALRSHVDNMEDYDIVFIGIPNWWNTTPMAVLTFVEEYDLSGKTIVPFVTHGTGSSPTAPVRHPRHRFVTHGTGSSPTAPVRHPRHRRTVRHYPGPDRRSARQCDDFQRNGRLLPGGGCLPKRGSGAGTGIGSGQLKGDNLCRM